MSDIAAFTIAALVAFWLGAPLWIVLVLAGLAVAIIIAELAS